MAFSPGPVCWLRKFGFFALIGLAVIFLTGPVIAVVSVVLSFVVVAVSLLLPAAVLGFLIWVPVRSLFTGSGAAWRDVRRTTQVVGQTIAVPVRSSLRLCQRTVQLGQRASQPAAGAASLLLGIVVETISGALVGALLVAVSGLSGVQPWHYWFGALLGSLFGALVAITRRSRAEETISEHV
jgi:hypothetical protein